MRLAVLAVSLVVGTARHACALTPDQIAIIVNSRSKASRDIALAYQTARGIPRDNIIFVDLDPGEEVEEPAYVLKIKAPIRRYLLEHKLERQITCLVTTYDVPLKVFAQGASPADQAEVMALRKRINAGMEEMQQSLKAFDAILPELSPAAKPENAPKLATTVDEVSTQLAAAAQRAAERIGRAEGDAKKHAAETYVGLYEKLLGTGGAITSRNIALLTMDDQALIAHLKPMVEAMNAADAQIVALARDEIEPGPRAKRMELMARAHGVLGGLRQGDHDMKMLTRYGSEGSVDSELTCLWNDRYFKAEWIINPICLEKFVPAEAGTIGPAATQPGVAPAFRPLMVCRLDGSTEAKALDLINTCLKIEKTGLEGIFYIDGDGKGSGGRDYYEVYDTDLRATYDYVKINSTMPVVLENTPALMKAADCPNAALYVGWYAPGNYFDSCQWLAGGVGYHVASAELVSLHTPGEKGWGVNLLNRGFAGTLGPTHEPYLQAFPKASQFFPLLLTGQWTQGEVYAMTTPYLSWRIAFVGDPLYNPFKVKPRLEMAKIKENALLKKALDIFPPPAATQPK